MYTELILITLATSIACVLPGTLLVVRGMALMSDALSHALLPGIVIMFLLFQKLNIPMLIFGASVAGIITVILTEAIIQTDRLKKDTAIGLVFPLFFSIGVILISYYARSIHLDMDMVILGHLIFTPFKRLYIYGIDYGPQALWIISIMACINCLITYALYKELLVSTFDPTLAHMSNFRPRMLHYGLMIITSITCVCAFDIVGAIVVVALMLVPPATAYILASTLSGMIWLALFFSTCCVWGGFLLAHAADVSHAGALATMSGCIFALVLITHRLCARKIDHDPLEHTILCAFLATSQEPQYLTNAARTLNWSTAYTHQVTMQCQNAGLIMYHQDTISLTPRGLLHHHQHCFL